ncbi:glycosyltransferase family 4 protein [Haloferax sp. DFSO60]|uniref:glycosyltransferase family 4 protein n=1 Tax=Haloferax sp. DFSO60 TaxID=3388652 RepID=UPI003977F73D
MLGWGFPPNVSGGLDTHVGELFERMEARDDIDIELVLPAEYAPDRPGITGVPTGEGDIITRIGRLSSAFAEHAEDADVIHTHDWFGYGPGSRAKTNNPDIEWITTFHSLSSDRNIDPPQREVETERRIADRCDHLLAVSKLLAGKVKEEYDGDCDVIYNGFSECETKGIDRKAELGIDGKMLFFVGRHTDQKGISHLIYALEKLDRDDVTLVMGGSGHLTDQLKRFAELIGVEDRIEWVGYVPEEELGDYYASADLFVSPSLSEPFGITIVEALSTGTRVVATESGAAEVLPEDCVVEVEPDSRSIAKGIEYALSLEGEPEYEPYTWDQVVDETVAYYHSVLEE